MSQLAREILEALDGSNAVVLATVIKSSSEEPKIGAKLLVREDGSSSGSSIPEELKRAIVQDCLTLVRERRDTQIARYTFDVAAQPEVVVEAYLELMRQRPVVIVVGAGHIGQHLTKIAKAVGFAVTVIDDRADFANAQLLPDADKVIAADIAESLRDLRIDENTYLVLVTRGHKHDEIALREVVNSPAAYVGMIGSRTRVRTVKERLLRDGFPKEPVEAVYAPIGLNIAAETPEEIALAIVAEMVKVRRAGNAASKRDRSGH